MSGGRVLLVLGPSDGGIGRHVRQLASLLPASGWDVTVAGPEALRAAGAPLQDAEVTFTAVEVPGPWRTGAGAFRGLRRLAATHDLVHAHGLRAGLVASLAARSVRRPAVVTLHNVVSRETAGAAWPLLRAAEPVLGRLADESIGASPDTAARLGAGAVTIHVSAPPLGPGRDRAEVRADLGLADDAVVFLTLARLHPQKRLDVLVEAAALAAQRRPGRLQFLLAGDGPLFADLDGRVRRSGAPLRLLGRRSDAADLLASADVFVLSSAWEASPLALLEAAAAGLPLVGTDAGGTPLIVRDGETGLLVPVGDPEALSTALVALADDPALRDRLGKQARILEEQRFSAGVMVEEIDRTYRRALHR